MTPRQSRSSEGFLRLAVQHRRQLLLFLLAICAPAALLVALGVRTAVQQRQLARQRVAERRQELAASAARGVQTLLDEIVAAESAARDDRFASAATVFIAPLEPGSPEASTLLKPDFRDRVDSAIRVEFVEQDRAAAIAAYRGILRGARDAAQHAYVLTLLARAQRSAGDTTARATSLRLLDVPLAVRDEHGVPFAAYGARALRGDTAAAAQLARLTPAILASRSMSATACYAFADASTAASIRRRCAEIETGESLLRDRAVMDALSQDSAAHWTSYADGRWLVRREPDFLIGLRADSIVAAMAQRAPAETRVTLAAAGADPLPGVPALGAVWTGDVAELRRAAMSAAFYGLALAVVLVVALLGAWFLWRDVRRESELARMRGQFVASVSHELRTPLTSIRMFAETLRDRATIEAEARTQYLDTIARETERLTRLLDNVLDFSRIERGERTYRMAPLSLPTIVERALSALRYPLDQQGFVVTLSSSEYMPLIRGDADALEQAVLNLLSNAIKYSGTSRSIHVALTHDNGTVAIAVRDAGLGIAPAHQTHLFERFYRAPVPENEAIPGTGLGLTLVEHIAAAHGGRVSLESAPGAGSTFTVMLPATA